MTWKAAHENAFNEIKNYDPSDLGPGFSQFFVRETQAPRHACASESRVSTRTQEN